MPLKDIPGWLRIAAESSECHVPLPDLLEDSLYYPASGVNGTPVKYLGGNVHSFIYADYSITVEGMLQNMYGTEKDCGFLGYTLLRHRDILHGELFPEGWKPDYSPTEEQLQKGLSSGTRHPMETAGHWTIWQRLKEYPETHGPELFSFLYVYGEMSKVYQALYTKYRKRPLVLAIIQPGCFGGEWERTEDEDSMFKKVLSANPAGMPDFLLYGGYGGDWFDTPCWKEYEGKRLVQLPERRAGLWFFSENEILSFENRYRTKRKTSRRQIS